MKSYQKSKLVEHPMRKLISITALLVIFLSACNPIPPAANPVPAGQAGQSEVKQTEVTWYVRPSAPEQKWENETIIPGFEKKYPNIKIILTVVPISDFDSKMQSMIHAGNPPDVWTHWGPSGFQDYVKRGLVADLSPYIEKDAYDLSDFQPEALKAYTVDGKIMGLPMLTTGSFLFYNKDLLDKAGVAAPTTNWDDQTWTYDKFLEMCKALTHVTGDSRSDVYGCNLDFWPNDAVAWMWGKDLYPESAYTTGFASTSFLNDPQVMAAYQARQEMVWKLKVQPTSAEIDAMGGGDLFKSQKIAMELTGGWEWWNLSGVKDFNWGAAALPYGSDGRRDVVFTDPWMMSAQTAHPNEAWSFLKYLSEAPQQESWMKLSGAAPARKSLAETWYRQFPGMSPEAVKEVTLGALKYGRESPNHLLVGFDALDKIVSAALAPVANNTRQAAEVLPEANQKLTAALNQIQSEFKK
jgi:multiple sugar transport system substrate-binding protein